MTKTRHPRAAFLGNTFFLLGILLVGCLTRWIVLPEQTAIMPSMTNGFRLLDREISLSSPTFDRMKIFHATNGFRLAVGIDPLEESTIMDAIAKRRVIDMQQLQYFGHLSATPYGADDMAQYFRYRYLRFGENIAFGSFPSEKSVVQAWMNSPGHRANILSEKFHEIGIASEPLEHSGREGIIIVEVFGLPIEDCPTIDRTLLEDMAAEESHIGLLQKAADEIRNLMGQVNISTEQGFRDFALYHRAHEALADNIEFRHNLILEMNDRYNAQVRTYNGCI